MRLILALASLSMIAAALSGCASNGKDSAASLDEPASAAFQQPLFEGEADQGAPAGDPHTHGQPQRDDGQVTTGMNPPLQLPGVYWARRTVTITNDFGGASLGTIQTTLASGAIKVETGQGEGYTIQAVLEADAMTEQQARDALDRIELTHTDSLEADGLHLTTVVDEKPPVQTIPGVSLGDSWTFAEVLVTLPAEPAYALTAETSSGDVTVGALRGPAFDLSASSGDVTVGALNAGNLQVGTSSGDVSLDTVKADHLQASASSGSIDAKDLRAGVVKATTSSGDITLAGAIDTLEADASSGSLSLDLHGLASGAYKLSASSGGIDLKLLHGHGRAYRVTADASSGSVSVKLDDAESTDNEDHHASAVSRDFDSAPIQTVIEASTSSGDITIQD